jgi:hypothetical protein
MVTKTGTGLRGIVMLSAAFLMVNGTGCTFIHKTFSSQPQQSQQKQTNKTVNPKAQKYYYDLGLQLYSKESYKEAKNAFQNVIDNGPNTTLGLKAQENITKIDQVLKTLEDIESK